MLSILGRPQTGALSDSCSRSDGRPEGPGALPGREPGDPQLTSLFFARGEERLVLYFECETDEGAGALELLYTVDPQPLWTGFHEELGRSCSLRDRAFGIDGRLLELDGDEGNKKRMAKGWEDLFLPAPVKEEIRFLVRRFTRTDRERFAEYGIRRRTGALLTGPPGTGKTTIGRILARELDCTFLWVKPSDFESPLRVRDGVSLARTLAATVLFIEDIENFGDQAIRDRPGRFDRRIEVLPHLGTSARRC